MTDTSLLRRHDVERIVGLSRSSIYAAMACGDFPRPVKIGKRAVAWRHHDIEVWVESREQSEGWS